MPYFFISSGKFICLLALYQIFMSGAKTQRVPNLLKNDPLERIGEVFWTNDTLPTGGKAYRDTLMEKVVIAFPISIKNWADYI